MALDSRKHIIVDGDTTGVQLAEWLVGRVWARRHADERGPIDVYGGSTFYLFDHDRAGDVDSRAVLDAAEVCARIDQARAMRSIAASLDHLTQVYDERSMDVLAALGVDNRRDGVPADAPPDEDEVEAGLEQLRETGEWEGRENDERSVDIALAILGRETADKPRMMC